MTDDDEIERYAYSQSTDTWYLVTEYAIVGDGQLKARSKVEVDRSDVPEDVRAATRERDER